MKCSNAQDVGRKLTQIATQRLVVITNEKTKHKIKQRNNVVGWSYKK